MRLAAGVWLIAGFALLTAPGTSAEQDPSTEAEVIRSSLLLETENLHEPAPPGGDAIQGTWSLVFETQAPAAGEVTIHLEAIDVPDGWSLVLEPSTVTLELLDVPQPKVRQTHEVKGTYTAQASSDTPAFMPEHATVLAWTDGNAVVQPSEIPDQAFLWADWRPGFSAEPIPIERTPEGSSVAAVELQNEGNGPARFTLEQIEGPEGCEVFAPSNAIVVPQNQSGVHELEVYCGGEAPSGPVSACIVQSYAPDMTLETRQRGVAWTVDEGLFGGSATTPDGCTGGIDAAEANATPLGGAVVAVAVLGAVAVTGLRSRLG